MTLRDTLDYEPVPLRFGTSGRRGRIEDLTQLEVYINCLGELEYLQTLPAAEGPIRQGDDFFIACDLRPSSCELATTGSGPGRYRGELVQAVIQAVADAGLRPVFLGKIPAPALAHYAFTAGKGSIMVTGSHIPFDRNGYKTNTARRELLKTDEEPVQKHVERVRRGLYTQPVEKSLFAATGELAGMFKEGSRALPIEDHAARQAYLRRYAGFFDRHALEGMRILVYQHSAVGRDMLIELLRELGAEVIPAGWSDSFVPIDTENLEESQLVAIQQMTEQAWQKHGPIAAVVSTDGDSDRPLILGVEPAQGRAAKVPCNIKFYGGDLVGMVLAEFLLPDAVVVPITCNDGIDSGSLKHVLQPKTRIGSPFVIAGMEKARAAGHRAICGWEANGGFLTGSDFFRKGRVLKALPTRDAFLPILGVLVAAKEAGLMVPALFQRLPPRFSRAALLKNFPRAVSQEILARFAPEHPEIVDLWFERGKAKATNYVQETIDPSLLPEHCGESVKTEVERFFPPKLGFDRLCRINYTDGLRLYFENGDIAHVRPSGNADELRIYGVAGSQGRADEIARLGVADPGGILRQMEQAVRAVN